MPESVPAPKSFIGSSGNAGSTWFQLLTVEPRLPDLLELGSTVRQSAQSFSGFTTTRDRVVGDLVSSLYAMPFFLQASISLALIGREASEMSVSPAQNFSKPPPVPEIPTVT